MDNPLASSADFTCTARVVTVLTTSVSQIMQGDPSRIYWVISHPGSAGNLFMSIRSNPANLQGWRISGATNDTYLELSWVDAGALVGYAWYGICTGAAPIGFELIESFYRPQLIMEPNQWRDAQRNSRSVLERLSRRYCHRAQQGPQLSSLTVPTLR